MATSSSILAWEILLTEEPGGYSPWSYRELYLTEHVHTAKKSTFFFFWPFLGAYGILVLGPAFENQPPTVES